MWTKAKDVPKAGNAAGSTSHTGGQAAPKTANIWGSGPNKATVTGRFLRKGSAKKPDVPG
jgi:hypothetical protein